VLALANANAFDESERITLEKIAGYGVASVEAATELLNGRQHLLRNEEAVKLVKEALQTIQDSGKGGLLTPRMTDKIARLADSIDRLAGQHVRYTPETLPERALYSLTLTQLDDFHKNAVHLANGAILTPEEAQDDRLQQFIENYTGEKVAGDQMKKKLEEMDEHVCNLALRVFAR
jgi:hypothetical protein